MTVQPLISSNPEKEGSMEKERKRKRGEKCLIQNVQFLGISYSINEYVYFLHQDLGGKEAGGWGGGAGVAQRQGLGADPRKQTPPGSEISSAGQPRPLRVVKAAAFWTASPGRAARRHPGRLCHARVPLI